MTAGSPTVPASDFPAPNLPPSAAAWGRAVAQRIAQLENQNSRQDGKILDLNHSLIGAMRGAGGIFNFRDDWIPQDPAAPTAGLWGPTYTFADDNLLPGMTISNAADVTVVGPGIPRQTAYPNSSYPNSLCIADSHTTYDSALGYYPFVDAYADWPVDLPLVPGSTATYTLYAAYQTWDRAGQGNPSAGPWEVAVLVDGVKHDLTDTESGWATLTADLGGPGAHTIEFRTYGTSAGASLYVTDIRIVQTVTGPPTGGQDYGIGDVVRHNGATWLAADIAAAGDEPGTTGSWKQIAVNGLNYVGGWVSAT